MSLDEASRPRVRSWIRKLALFVLPVLLVILGIAVWDYVEIGRLTREIEAIRAKGEPINGNALIDPQYGQADNAEYKYAAAAILTTSPATYSAVEGWSRGSAMQVYSSFAPIRQWLSGGSPAPSLDRFQAATKELTSEWQEAFSLVDKAAASPYRGVLPGGEYSYRVAGLWNLLRLLSARTIGLAVNGEGDAAVNSAISSIKLRRAIRPSQRFGPTMHEVPAVLSLSKPSEDALSRLQKALADEEDAAGPTRDFLAARAQLLDIMLRRGYGTSMGLDNSGGMAVRGPFPWELLGMRPLFTHRLVSSLRAWSELAEIAHKPWPQRAALAAGPIERYSAGERPNRAMSSTGMAVMWFNTAFRPEALIYDRCSRIAVAIERYRRTHGESLPAGLTDLVPNYLAELPEDPLTGKPLLYRIDADAYLVYSVGSNGKDDGGSLLLQAPNADTGIRVLIRK